MNEKEESVEEEEQKHSEQLYASFKLSAQAPSYAMPEQEN